MLPDVFALLKASAAVTAILGATPKVYRHGQAPQGVTAPYVTWTTVGIAPYMNLSDLPEDDRVAMQVDCYHTTDAGIEDLAQAVRDAIEPSACMTGVLLDQREPDTGLYRVSLQFDWLLSR